MTQVYRVVNGVVISDPQNVAATLVQQMQGRMTGTCSVCEAEGFKPWELDDSGRCEECRP
jgi:hypothetical protein